MMNKEESKLGGEDLSSNDLLYRTKTKEALLCLIKKKSQFHEQHSKKKKKTEQARSECTIIETVIMVPTLFFFEKLSNSNTAG